MLNGVLIDSSAWIDFFNKKTSAEIEHLKLLLLTNAGASPLVIVIPIIIQEIFQGIRQDETFKTIKKSLLVFPLLLTDSLEYYLSAADLYRFLRTKGVTIRKSEDCLIAAVCLKWNLAILHKDKDFENISKYTNLKIYNTNT